MVRLAFLGAMNQVGSSGVLVETEGSGRKRFVMDYGTNIQNDPPSFPHKVNGKIDAAFLSHAHLDHSGGMAILTRRNNCPIYSTAVTKPLVQMLLNDSIKISKSEGTILPFGKDDVKRCIRSFKTMQYDNPITFGKVKVIAYDAGHIPGSMMTFLHMENGNSDYNTLLYTGDMNTRDTRLVKGCTKSLPEVDVLITESTYAARDHKNRKLEEKKLIKYVDETLARDGILLLSNFAISRSQEVMLILNEYGIDYPLYMDGMAKKATTIINSHTSSTLNPRALDKALKKVEYIGNTNQRKRAIKNPCVIMTTSGMLNGGPIVWYLEQVHNDPVNMLVMTGYQVEGTPGRNLLETGRFSLDESDFKLKMKFDRLDFSSHAGRKDLFEFVKRVNPKKVFCVHGDDTIGFAEDLREEGFDATAPTQDNRTFQF